METPQAQPIPKKIQFHCALSKDTAGILCTFQCNSKEELDKHINQGHKSFPCADKDCKVECENLDHLSNHVATMHKSKQMNDSSEIKCNNCEMKFKTKSELLDHIKVHKSYKLCKNYALNKCGPESECRYKHMILPPGVHICYKCGVTSASKTDIMRHIRAKHGDEICHNFILNRCEYQSCMFSHNTSSAPSVEKIPERVMVTPSAPLEANFGNLSTIGPVVGTEERAQPHMEGLSPQQQEMIKQVAVKQITMYMEQMLPQILAQITDSLTKKTPAPQ